MANSDMLLKLIAMVTMVVTPLRIEIDMNRERLNDSTGFFDPITRSEHSLGAISCVLSLYNKTVEADVLTFGLSIHKGPLCQKYRLNFMN